MARKPNTKDRETLKKVIENHPNERKGFFARLLGWHPQKVDRELVYLEDDRYLLYEDDDDRISPL